MTNIEHHLIDALLREIQDDIARAERLGRATVDLMAVRYYAERIEELLETEQQPTNHRREAKEQ